MIVAERCVKSETYGSEVPGVGGVCGAVVASPGRVGGVNRGDPRGVDERSLKCDYDERPDRRAGARGFAGAGVCGGAGLSNRGDVGRCVFGVGGEGELRDFTFHFSGKKSVLCASAKNAFLFSINIA